MGYTGNEIKRFKIGVNSMKRKILSLLMTMVMLAGLVCSLTVPAFANDGGGDPEYYTGTVDSEVSWQINMRAGYDVKRVTNISGVLPDGLRTRVRNGALYVVGTPTQIGTFKANIHVRATLNGETWNDQLPCVFTIQPGERHKDYSLPTSNVTAQVDNYKKLSFDMDSSGYITKYDYRGNIPNGMGINMDRYGIYISGTPTQSGTYLFTLTAYNSELRCNVSQPVSMTVKGPSIPTVTKSPTSETVDEGGRALFVARATDYNSITWYVSKNGVTYQAVDAPYYFPGLTVSGTGGETLTLNNIPLSMDGWLVQAKFLGGAGTVYSGQAKVNVKSTYIAPPAVQQPDNVVMNPGEEATIRVNAASPDGSAMEYQWYELLESNSYRATPIEGACGPTLTVDYAEGERYYNCEVWCYNNKYASEAVYTEIITVTGKPAPTEPAPTEAPTQPAETTPAPTETAPVPTETVPAQTAATESATQPTQPAPQPQPQAKDHTVAYIVGGVAVVAMICCTAVLITVLNKGKYSKK